MFDVMLVGLNKERLVGCFLVLFCDCDLKFELRLLFWNRVFILLILFLGFLYSCDVFF